MSHAADPDVTVEQFLHGMNFLEEEILRSGVVLIEVYECGIIFVCGFILQYQKEQLPHRNCKHKCCIEEHMKKTKKIRQLQKLPPKMRNYLEDDMLSSCLLINVQLNLTKAIKLKSIAADPICVNYNKNNKVKFLGYHH